MKTVAMGAAFLVEVVLAVPLVVLLGAIEQLVWDGGNLGRLRGNVEITYRCSGHRSEA